ncbi:ribonuclease PH, partial [Bradyrhizobium sp. INPA01-394B]|nr:ribonuclease PH [Bradyrhizobium campsiandrae]
MRVDGRGSNALRNIEVTPDYLMHPEGSVLIASGNTKVICSASVETKVPPFMRGEGRGWISAEYSMLPRATKTRNIRESSNGKETGRTMAIKRLTGPAPGAVAGSAM